MNLQAQETYILSGTVTDSITGEPLPGTSVFLVSESAGTQADEKGHYTITVKKGMHVIRFSFIGYQSFETRVNIKSNQPLNAILAPAATQTQSVIITARNPGESTESTKTGLVEFTGKEMKRMPTLMGETDVIRVLNYSPGSKCRGWKFRILCQRGQCRPESDPSR